MVLDKSESSKEEEKNSFMIYFFYLQLNISSHIPEIYIINDLKPTIVNYEKMDTEPGQQRKYTI